MDPRAKTSSNTSQRVLPSRKMHREPTTAPTLRMKSQPLRNDSWTKMVNSRTNALVMLHRSHLRVPPRLWSVRHHPNHSLFPTRPRDQERHPLHNGLLLLDQRHLLFNQWLQFASVSRAAQTFPWTKASRNRCRSYRKMARVVPSHQRTLCLPLVELVGRDLCRWLEGRMLVCGGRTRTLVFSAG